MRPLEPKFIPRPTVKRLKAELVYAPKLDVITKAKDLHARGVIDQKFSEFVGGLVDRFLAGDPITDRQWSALCGVVAYTQIKDEHVVAFR